MPLDLSKPGLVRSQQQFCEMTLPRRHQMQGTKTQRATPLRACATAARRVLMFSLVARLAQSDRPCGVSARIGFGGGVLSGARAWRKHRAPLFLA